MSTAQELLGLLVNAKPGPNYTPKPKPAPKPERVTSLYAEAMPDWIAVELPALGGSACIISIFDEPRHAIGAVSTRSESMLYRLDCKRCSQPLRQKLINRTFAGGECWSQLPCTSCGGLR